MIRTGARLLAPGLLALGLVPGSAVLAAPTGVVPAAEECGLPVFVGDVKGDGSGTVRVGTERGACAETVEVKCEDGMLVVGHTPAATGRTTVHHPTDGDIACEEVGAVRVRVFGGSDRVLLPGLDDLAGIDGGDGTWHVDVDLGRGDDRFRGSEQAEDVDAGPGNDRVLAGAGDDLLHGGPGRDRLFGERGRDFLLGGRGRDELHGGAGFDCVFQGDRGECGYGGVDPV